MPHITAYLGAATIILSTLTVIWISRSGPPPDPTAPKPSLIGRGSSVGPPSVLRESRSAVGADEMGDVPMASRIGAASMQP
eukprot:SAG11_NODE_2307_length_3546_cov_2.779809_4_plen_81_part_00